MKAARMGMTVHASDGEAGRVDDVLVNDETGQPAYLVLNAGGFFKGDVVAPFESVQSIDEAGVWLSLTRQQIKDLPAYDAARYGASAGLVSRAAGRYEEE